jgi:hypothetical protein
LVWLNCGAAWFSCSATRLSCGAAFLVWLNCGAAWFSCGASRVALECHGPNPQDRIFPLIPKLNFIPVGEREMKGFPRFRRLVNLFAIFVKRCHPFTPAIAIVNEGIA